MPTFHSVRHTQILHELLHLHEAAVVGINGATQKLFAHGRSTIAGRSAHGFFFVWSDRENRDKTRHGRQRKKLSRELTCRQRRAARAPWIRPCADAIIILRNCQGMSHSFLGSAQTVARPLHKQVLWACRHT